MVHHYLAQSALCRVVCGRNAWVQTFLSTDAVNDSEQDRRRMLVGMWRQQAKMYGLDIDVMLADGLQDGGQGTPPPSPSTVSARDDGAARSDNAGVFATALEADQSAP